jgi:hypothetical protein
MTVTRRVSPADGGYRSSHIFDGASISRPVGSFQICDITDPLLKSIASNPIYVRSECDVSPWCRLSPVRHCLIGITMRQISTGWYIYEAERVMHQILKRKFDGLFNGTPVSDMDCEDLLLALPSSDRDARGAREGSTMWLIRPKYKKSHARPLVRTSETEEQKVSCEFMVLQLSCTGR